MASIILPQLPAYGAWPVHALEIGGGYGGLAHAMLKARGDYRHCIVDLAPQLDCVNYYLRETGLRGRAYLLQPQHLESWPMLDADLYIQTRGFMEMSPEEVAWYMGLIQQHAPVGALFFCINKVSKQYQDSCCESNWRDYGWDDKWEIVLADHWQERHPMPMVLLRRSSEPVEGTLETIRGLAK